MKDLKKRYNFWKCIKFNGWKKYIVFFLQYNVEKNWHFLLGNYRYGISYDSEFIT